MKKSVRPDAEIVVLMYDRIKYDLESRNDLTAKYKAGKIAYFDVISGKEAEEFEKSLDADSIDDNHEYLMLYFSGSDDVASFRNSYVDMFVI